MLHHFMNPKMVCQVIMMMNKGQNFLSTCFQSLVMEPGPECQ